MSDCNYKYKYKKYFKKNQQLLNQLGGNMFDIIFVDLINYCLEYNFKRDSTEELFGQHRFVHIKGGSSIRYHLMKHMQPKSTYENITNDLDLFFISEDDSPDHTLNDFIGGLRNLFTDYNITHRETNGLIVVSFNGINIIDITIVTDAYNNQNPESSMFAYACEQIGLTENAYFNELDNIAPDVLSDYNMLEQKTFTSIEFEIHATTKGIEIYQKYVDSIPKWKARYKELLHKSNNLTLPIEERRAALRLAIEQKHQISDTYINNLNLKLFKYTNKLRLLTDMLILP